jgi:hypothetical protein
MIVGWPGFAPLVGFVFLSSLQWNLSIRVLKFQKIKSPQV